MKLTDEQKQGIRNYVGFEDARTIIDGVGAIREAWTPENHKELCEAIETYLDRLREVLQFKPQLWVLYDYDRKQLVTTIVYESYQAAVDDLDPRLSNVIVVALDYEGPEADPDDEPEELDDDE